MRSGLKYFYFLFCIPLFFLGTAHGDNRQSSDSEVLKNLKFIPGATVQKIRADSLFNSAYKILLKQPLDHFNTDTDSFAQKIYLSFLDFTKPMVFVTEGYAKDSNETYELTRLLDGNQLIIEHRYFGESKPDSMNWEYLNTKQAATDHHRIIKIFKNLFPGKWISTGISKGGQTTIYHRYYYPDDVDATVSYVSPLNFAQEDPRIATFLEQVGDNECRKKIKQFQKLVLLNREKILPKFKWYSIAKDYAFGIGMETAFEYAVLEYPFSFWQWGYSDCHSISQEKASIDEIFNELKTVVDFFLFSNMGIQYYQPFFYQAITELGYYGYDTKHLKGLLKSIPEPDNLLFAPPDVPMVFNNELNKNVSDWLKNYGNNFIFIYGELDPWSAPAVELSDKINSIKIIKKGGNHRTRISHISKDDKNKIISALENWLGIQINRKWNTH
jgi:hypothetical protein